MKIISTSKVDRPDFPDNVIRVDYESTIDGHKGWSLVRPGKDTHKWAVVIHGHGSHGDQLFTRQDIKETRLPVFIKAGLSILSPNLRDNAWMGPNAAADLHRQITWLRTTYHAEEFFFISASMGGTSNLIYSVLYPEDVTAVSAGCPATDIATYYRWCIKALESNPPNAATIKEIAEAIETAYYGTPDENPELYAAHSALGNAEVLTMPLHLEHGDADTLIPVEESRRLAEKLDGKLHFVYNEIKNGGHDSPLHEGNSLEWLLKVIQQ